jgi:hypothetical protein
MNPNLSAAQVRNRLILTARCIVAEHWPGADGLCPICRTPDCLALATACAYLNAVNDPYLPTRRP